MKINTVALMGAGAIGCYFIWGLSDKLGDNFCVVAEGGRKARLEKDGLIINGKAFYPRVLTPPEAKGADLLIISTKYDALKSSLPEIAEIVGDDTTVMSVLNGVDSEEIIGDYIGREHMLYSLMRFAAERRGNEVVFIPQPGLGVIFGEIGQREPSERMLAVADVFEGTTVNGIMSENIVRDIWVKYMINISRNLPQAVLDVGAGVYNDSEYGSFICRSLREEVVAVAAAKGITISQEEGIVTLANPEAKAARYSTLQDLDAGRHTEINMLAGVLMKFGHETGVPTPYTEVMYTLIRILEEKNDGKFNYLR